MDQEEPQLLSNVARRISRDDAIANRIKQDPVAGLMALVRYGEPEDVSPERGRGPDRASYRVLVLIVGVALLTAIGTVLGLSLADESTPRLISITGYVTLATLVLLTAIEAFRRPSRPEVAEEAESDEEHAEGEGGEKPVVAARARGGKKRGARRRS